MITITERRALVFTSLLTTGVGAELLRFNIAQINTRNIIGKLKQNKENFFIFV